MVKTLGGGVSLSGRCPLYNSLVSGNLWTNLQSTSYEKQEILSLLHKFIFLYWFTEWKPGTFSGL